MTRTLIKIKDIPPGAKKLVNLSSFPDPKHRTITLPTVFSKMYELYKSWDQSVELTALTHKWIQIINLAHTTKVLLDDEKHAKALEAMLRKAVLCKNFNKNLLFNEYEWNVLRQNIKARYFRDEPTRKVVIKIFQHSDGLKQKLARFTRIREDLEGMGIGWEETEYLETSDGEFDEALDASDKFVAEEESVAPEDNANTEALDSGSNAGPSDQDSITIEECYTPSDDGSAVAGEVEKDDRSGEDSGESQYVTPSLYNGSDGGVLLDDQSTFVHDLANRLEALTVENTGVAIEAGEDHTTSQLEKPDSYEADHTTLQEEVALKKGKEVATDEATHNNSASSTLDSTVPTDDKDIHDQLSKVAPPSLEFDHDSGLLLCKDYFPDKTLQWTINLRGFATDAISRGRTMVNDMSLDDLLMTTEATIDSKLSEPWWESGYGAKHQL